VKHHVVKFIGLFVLVIILNSSVDGQSQPDDGTEEPTKTSAIKGRVVNESGQPLANVSVSVRAYGAVGQSRITTTDSDGNFKVGDLDPVGYLVAASAPSYTTPPRDPNNPQVTYYRVGDSVRLELVKGGVITGIVTTQTGEPVVAVRVRAQMIRDANGRPPRYWPIINERTTDDRGVYRIYGLVPGTYVVLAGGGASLRFNRTAYDTDAPTYAPSSTRNDAAEITVGAGQEISNVDIRHRGEPGYAVSGFARGPAGISAPSAFQISLMSVQNGITQSSYSVYQPPGSSGFAIYGVADGDYDATALVSVPEAGWSVSDPKRIKVKGADVTGLELITKPLGSIKGRVVLEEARTSECKGKLRPSFAEMLVTPWHNEKNEAKDRPQFMFSYGAPSVPDKQGDFTLRNLAAGEYRFSARFFARYWYLQSITLPAPANATSKPSNSSLDKARNWTVVKSGDQISNLTITLAEGAASVRGSVQPAKGETLPARINVHLIPAEKEKADDVLRFFAVIAESDRKFSVSNVPPGRYFVFATVVTDNESATISKLRLPDEVEARGKLRLQAEAAKTEIELKPCQNLIDYQLTLKEPTRVSRPD
jgi:carboxypeptidase family protein